MFDRDFFINIEGNEEKGEGKSLRNVYIRAVRKRNWYEWEVEVNRIERRSDENPKGKPKRDSRKKRVCSWNLERQLPGRKNKCGGGVHLGEGSPHGLKNME